MDNLIKPFMTCALFRNFCKELIENQSPEIAILALNGLFHMESEVESNQFQDTKDVRDFLRTFGNEMPIFTSRETFGRGKKVARSLTIFKTLKVPLFIDDYGKKELLGSYETTEITIDENTPIYHVTHQVEADSIEEERYIRPSDNKNIIEGCWFGLRNPKQKSVYGSRAFKTTLSKLGVTGLLQGDIVSYNYEVNVILYADEYKEKKNFRVWKPTDRAVKSMNNNAYVQVSIFVPSVFLPDPERFPDVMSGPFEVEHGPFCVRAKRSHVHCRELDPLS